MPVGIEDDPWPEEATADAVPPGSANVGPTTAPPVEPGSGAQEAHRVTAVEMSEDQPKPSAEFPPEFRRDFEGLLYTGKLTASFEWLGHAFVISTIPGDVILEASLLHEQYAGTIAAAKAWEMLLVAACIETVDGRPLPSALGSDEHDLIHRFNYVKRWYGITHDKVHEEYLLLEDRQVKVVEAMGEAVG